MPLPQICRHSNSISQVDGTPKATLTVPESKRGAVTEHRAIETLLFLPEKARVLAALALDATVYFWRLIDQELVYTSAPPPPPPPSALRPPTQSYILLLSFPTRAVSVVRDSSAWQMKDMPSKQETSPEAREHNPPPLSRLTTKRPTSPAASAYPEGYTCTHTQAEDGASGAGARHGDGPGERAAVHGGLAGHGVRVGPERLRLAQP